jgi:hypothetical protein
MDVKSAFLSHPVLEGKPNANHVRVRIRNSRTGETPFFLVYGAEAYLPPETLMGSPRVQLFDESMQEQLRREDMDFIDERRWQAAIRNAWYNRALRRYHQRFVHSRELGVGDLVLRRVLNQEGLHKLSPVGKDPSR